MAADEDGTGAEELEADFGLDDDCFSFAFCLACAAYIARSSTNTSCSFAAAMRGSDSSNCFEDDEESTAPDLLYCFNDSTQLIAVVCVVYECSQLCAYAIVSVMQRSINR